ncbi:MAG: glycosyltransferase family 2 protein [Planctomycetes bacterium]|nr:glycosyltransferase family 2 protein [Planctomycetota bacterium]
MSAPLVSAIVPTYRRPQLLERSLGSVLRQTYRPLELVVIDDGSGDDTPDVLESFSERARQAGVEYTWFSKQNGGPAQARNAGMERAKGELLAFLDDDDRWYPQKLETQLALMRTHPQAGVSFTRYVHEGKENQPKPKPEQMRDGWVFETLCSGQTRAHMQTLVVSREVQRRVGGFIDARNWEDSDWQLRLALETEFLAVREPLTVICTVESSISREAGLEGDLQRDRDKLRLLDALVARHGDHPRFKREAAKLLRARIYDEHIKHFIWLGRVDDARAAWQQALEECGEQPLLAQLKGKLKRARVAGWFGRKLKKP